MARSFEYSVEANLENLKDFRKFVQQSGRALGIDEKTLGDLCLVVDEAVTNVVHYGYGGNGGPVDLEIGREVDAVVIAIRDRAEAFDASEVKTPQLDTPLAERAFGGMGVFLIRKLTDEAVFKPLPGGGNELRLVKRNVFMS